VKIKLDENLPKALEDLLHAAGHDVTTVPQEALGGSSDPRVLDAARDEDRLLMTFDMDFADIRQYPVGSHAGIVVFRLRDQRWPALEQPARQLLVSGILSALGRGLAIVDEARVRIRSKHSPK
jgi:predicted nuclease of predicted toxin-antitoxin system